MSHTEKENDALSSAADFFQNGHYEKAATILQKKLYETKCALPIHVTQHNHFLSQFYSNSEPRQSVLQRQLLRNLTNLEQFYPSSIPKKAIFLFNKAEVYLNRHQYTKGIHILRQFIDNHSQIPMYANIYLSL